MHMGGETDRNVVQMLVHSPTDTIAGVRNCEFTNFRNQELCPESLTLVAGIQVLGPSLDFPSTVTESWTEMHSIQVCNPLKWDASIADGPQGWSNLSHYCEGTSYF